VQAKVHERSERESVRYRDALGDELVHGGRSEPSPTSEVKVRGVHEAEVGRSRCHSRKHYAYEGTKVGRSLSRVAWPGNLTHRRPDESVGRKLRARAERHRG
jgi:hypothetical protein